MIANQKKTAGRAGGGVVENKEFSLEHVKFQVLMIHPSRHNEVATEYTREGTRG